MLILLYVSNHTFMLNNINNYVVQVLSNMRKGSQSPDSSRGCNVFKLLKDEDEAKEKPSKRKPSSMGEPSEGKISEDKPSEEKPSGEKPVKVNNYVEMQ